MLPSISIVIPTLNAATHLGSCLESVAAQDYPKEKIETLIIDGGSKDETIRIAQRFSAKVLKNILKTGEAGKAMGIRKAKNELILLIDSDNILVGKDWLEKMVQPFTDKQIVATEPLYYVARPTDSLINRYCALIGMNDPLCMFLGNYDRYNYITDKWTEVPIKTQDNPGYIKFRASGKRFMTMGANGFLARRTAVLPYSKNDYYFDIDVTKDLAVSHKTYFAKVDIGIIHIFANDLGEFIKKQKRRVQDYLYFRQKRTLSVHREEKDSELNIAAILKFSLSTVLTIPLLIQMTRGYIHKPDKAWLLHIPVCYVTLFIYVSNVCKAKLFSITHMMNRENW